MPAEFLCNLPKNLTTHLTHKLYSVFPKPWKSGYVGKLGIFYQELLETENNNGGTRT